MLSRRILVILVVDRPVVKVGFVGRISCRASLTLSTKFCASIASLKVFPSWCLAHHSLIVLAIGNNSSSADSAICVSNSGKSRHAEIKILGFSFSQFRKVLIICSGSTGQFPFEKNLGFVTHLTDFAITSGLFFFGRSHSPSHYTKSVFNR